MTLRVCESCRTRTTALECCGRPTRPPLPLDDRTHSADPRWHEPDRHERILNDITTEER